MLLHNGNCFLLRPYGPLMVMVRQRPYELLMLLAHQSATVGLMGLHTGITRAPPEYTPRSLSVARTESTTRNRKLETYGAVFCVRCISCSAKKNARLSRA